MRKGAPFHGALGEGNTATSAVSSQMLDDLWACESAGEKRETKKALATSNDAVAAKANWRAGNT
jgi:hypothetical protein